MQEDKTSASLTLISYIYYTPAQNENNLISPAINFGLEFTAQ